VFFRNISKDSTDKKFTDIIVLIEFVQDVFKLIYDQNLYDRELIMKNNIIVLIRSTTRFMK
jgi:hypothetical protein